MITCATCILRKPGNHCPILKRVNMEGGLCIRELARVSLIKAQLPGYVVLTVDECEEIIACACRALYPSWLRNRIAQAEEAAK